MAEAATLTPPPAAAEQFSSMSAANPAGTTPSAVVTPPAPVAPVVTTPVAAAPVVPVVEAKTEPPKAGATLLAAEIKAGDAPVAKTEPAPVTDYKLTLPADARIQPEHVAKVEAFAKAQGMTQKQAQEMVNRDNATLAALYEDAKQVTLNDPEIGGIHLQQTIADAQRGLAAVAPQAVRDRLMASPLGNDRDFLLVLRNIARLIPTEDVSRRSTPAPAKAENLPVSANYYGKAYYDAQGNPIQRA